MSLDVEELRFPSGDIQLYGRLRAPQHGSPTVVLLPGLGFHTFEYEPLAEALAGRGFGCLSVDHRGHGHSGGRRGSWTLNDLAADASAAIDVVAARRTSPIALFGNSLGGMVAIITGANDRRVAGVAAANAPDRIGDFLLTGPRRMLFAIAKLIDRALPLRVDVGHFYGYDQLIDDSSWRASIAGDPLIADARRLTVTTYRALLEDWDGRRAVATLHTPLLLIQGRDDRLQPPEQAELLRSAANEPCELVFVNTGHLPHLENTALVSEVLAGWLDRSLAHA